MLTNEEESVGFKASTTKRSSMYSKSRPETIEKRLCVEIKDNLGQWCSTFRRSFDPDNCSSNSHTFYFLLFVIGSIEMMLSVCVLMDIRLIENTNKSIEPFSVNQPLFALAFSIEIGYWIVTRIFLAKTYAKQYEMSRSLAFIIISIGV